MDFPINGGVFDAAKSRSEQLQLPDVATGTNTVRFLTLNLGLLALRLFGLGRISFVSYLDERLAAAPAHLQMTAADVIALQEVYTAQHRRFLQFSLRDTHPYACAPRNFRSVLGNGLMLLSRYPISNGEFLPLPREKAIHSAMFEKGCLRVDIDLPKIGTVRLVNVHLTVDSPFGRMDAKKSEQTRLAQIEHMLSVARPPDRDPAILLGDFNCSPVISTEKYRRIVEAGFIDSFASLMPPDVADNFVTWDASNPLNAISRFRDSPSQRIDHIFIPQTLMDTMMPVKSSIKFTEPTIAVSGARSVTLSDHYGLLVQLAIHPAPPKR